MIAGIRGKFTNWVRPGIRWLERRNVRWWRVGLAVAVGVLIFIAVATMVGVIVAWRSDWNQTDRLAAVGDSFTGGGLALALVAAIVATLAYGVAIEEPDVQALLTFPGSDTNLPVLVLDRTRPVGGEVQAALLADFPQVNCSVRLQNRRGYTARNPVVRVELMNMWGISGTGHWVPVTPITSGAQGAVRWSGGLDNSVHGHDIADLPVLSFNGVVAADEGSHELVVAVLAEGYRRTQVIPVRLQSPQEWVADDPKRVNSLPTHLR